MKAAWQTPEGNYQLYCGDCIAVMDAMPENSVDLVFGSPPYMDARTYGIGAQRKCEEWVQWMLSVSESASRISRGPVLWVAAGVTRKRCYWPGVEGLMWEWWKLGGTHELYRPCIYHRCGIPGSGGNDWFRADTEYVVCLKKPEALAWADNTACGHPPKWAPGGEMSNRLSSGQRVNQWGPVGGPSDGGARRANGNIKPARRPSHRSCTVTRANEASEIQGYVAPVKANPGNVIHCKVGGGKMGHKLAHENEAPFPEDLARFFVLSCCPPDGIVLEPFIGSGTTMAVAYKNNRKAIGIDIRESQIEIVKKRMADINLSLLDAKQ